MMSILVEELLQLVAEFNDREIEFALCGGLAVAAHGFTRATQDIDFLIREESLERAYEAAAKVGFDIRGLDMSFKERTVEIRRVSKIVGEDVISLDLLLVTQHVEDVWEEREWKEVEGEVIPIVSRNGLIKMKRQAGRSQDLTDIERLENEAG
ncbi:MAG: nucleotidyltransferase [Acidobacteria bacterium]|nr:nucleotidyltransferase [Acidobacteriota bacterium]